MRYKLSWTGFHDFIRREKLTWVAIVTETESKSQILKISENDTASNLFDMLSPILHTFLKKILYLKDDAFDKMFNFFTINVFLLLSKLKQM